MCADRQKRFTRRTATIIFIMLLLAIGGFWVLTRPPQLRLYHRHTSPWLLYGLHGRITQNGYPGFEATGKGIQWLDAACRPIASNAPEVRLSPSGKYAILTKVTLVNTKTLRYGMIQRVFTSHSLCATRQGYPPLTPIRAIPASNFLSDNVVITEYTPKPFTIQGQPMALPKFRGIQYKPIYQMISEDPRYLALYNAGDAKLYLYDVTAQRIVSAWHFRNGINHLPIGRMFALGDRLLAVGGETPAVVCEQGRKVAGFRQRGGWTWEEDGTVWAPMPGNTLRVVRWRQGTPRVVTLSMPGKPVQPRQQRKLTVHNDGHLIAVADRHPIPTQLVNVAARLHMQRYIASTWRLALYRDRRCIGIYTLRDSSSGNGEIRLNFSPDNRYLACATVDSLYVFTVPRK